MTQVVVQIHSAVLTSLGWGGCYICPLMHTLNSEWVSAWVKKYPQGSSVLWVGTERSYIGILKEISGCPCAGNEGTLHCRRGSKGKHPSSCNSNESGHDWRGKKMFRVFQLLWHTAILICNPAIHTASLLSAIVPHHENHWTKLTT